MPNDKTTKITNTIIKKSRAIYNSAVKKPATKGMMLARKAGATMDIARSRSISHFTAHTKPNSTTVKTSPNIAPTRHPLTARVDQIRAAKIAPVKPVKTMQATKNEAIARAMAQTSTPPAKPGFIKRHLKFINIFTIGLAILITAGVIVYLNMPSISVRIASAQAGIEATFPEYHPDGYSVNGPVSYADNEVTINFRANTGDTKFTIKQAKSTWDSSAVKGKVEKDSKNEFITTEEKGLTIYTYNGNAAWVNGGILYTIEGNAPLSGDQIRRIATSL